MIIVVGNEKGGVGKSTIAINLAICFLQKNHDLILVDTDKQATSTNFVSQRAKVGLPKLNSVQKFETVDDTLTDLSLRYSQVIVDAGGQDSVELRSAMAVADILIIPIKASQIDLWALSRMNELIKRVKALNKKIRILAVMSMVSTNPMIKEREGAEELLQEYNDIKLASNVIFDRKIYRDSIIEGKGVIEMNNDKATEEMKMFFEEVYNGE